MSSAKRSADEKKKNRGWGTRWGRGTGPPNYCYTILSLVQTRASLAPVVNYPSLECIHSLLRLSRSYPSLVLYAF